MNLLAIGAVRLYQVLTHSGGGPGSYSDKALADLRSVPRPRGLAAVRAVAVRYGDWGWNEREQGIPILKWWM